MIDRLPKCLHTCLHCRHAVILESYTGVSKKLIFDGCWKTDSIELPLAREECDKFEESPDRIKRKYWEKWNWKVYVDKDLVEQVRPEEGSGEVHEQESEQGKGEVHGQLDKREHSGPEQLTQGSQEPCEQPIVHIEDLPQGPGISLEGNAHSAGPDHDHRKGKENDEADFIQASELLKECNTKEEKEKSDEVHEQSIEPRANLPTRELILQALANNISRLKDIAHFASVNPSTAHYHLSKLIRSGQVERSG
ncbi:MAG: winged helix-turn-helix transcriptional regulator [Theionarchaea archaeon]|nr:winged helix-turn-helix transcriptional regulator [Theionarchaea archaeon]